MNPALAAVGMALTVLVTIGLAAYSSRLARTTGDFYVASRSVPAWWNASAISGEYLSAASFLGVAGLIMAGGADAVWCWSLAAIALALAAWAWTRARSGGSGGWRVVALLALLAMAWPLASLHRLHKPATANTNANPSGIAQVAFSEQALADLRAQGRVVFVNMTADWCVSCKANEKAVFARDGFRAAMDAANAVYMVGDYTDVDPAITAYLQRHQAVGVPLYVVYPRNGGEGRILPVIVTPGLVADALAQAAGG